MRSPRLIVVTGLPGTGKTRLARRLALRYSIPLIAKDTIKEPLLDGLDAETDSRAQSRTDPRAAARSRELSDLSFAILFSLAKELMAAGVDLIVEGNFRGGEHPVALLAVLPERPVRIFQILCRTEETERQRRLAARAADPARHPGHRDALQTAPRPDCDRFMELPGERLLFDSDGDSGGADAREAERMKTLDEYWWNAP